MRHVQDAVELRFNGDRYLLLNLLSRMPRPLRNHLDPSVGHIGVRFHGKRMERDHTPDE